MTFVKGNNANPLGRGAGKGEFTRALMQVLYELADAKQRPLGDYKKIDRVVHALVDKALEGDVPAIREIAERIEGRVPTPIVDIEGRQRADAAGGALGQTRNALPMTMRCRMLS